MFDLLRALFNLNKYEITQVSVEAISLDLMHEITPNFIRACAKDLESDEDYQQAFDVLVNDKIAKAIDTGKEASNIRAQTEQYIHYEWAKSCIIARFKHIVAEAKEGQEELSKKLILIEIHEYVAQYIIDSGIVVESDQGSASGVVFSDQEMHEVAVGADSGKSDQSDQSALLGDDSLDGSFDDAL